MNATHCTTCGKPLVFIETGALCPDHGNIVPTQVIARALSIADRTDDGKYLVSQSVIAGRCRKKLELMALPVATLANKQLGHYEVGGTLFRKAKNRQGATVANYNGSRIWLRKVGEDELVCVGVVEVQQEFI